MRHAKSDWSSDSNSDIERPLNPRGRAAAPVMADWLVANHLVPSVILCSSATRTQETLQLMQQRWLETTQVSDPLALPKTFVLDDLYLAVANTILTIASSYTAHDSILVLGHNPGMQDLVSYLSQSEQEMPTAAIAFFEAVDQCWPTKWLDVNSWAWRGLVKPRSLGKNLE